MALEAIKGQKTTQQIAAEFRITGIASIRICCEIGRWNTADEVWCADITYVPMPRGHVYLCAVMDWHSRRVLGWAVSNTMDSALREKAVKVALAQSLGLPEIFNTDQGSQFTSPEWTGRLESLGIAVSMDGKGRWMDNVFIERLWRSLKYEDIYLKGYASVGELETGSRPMDRTLQHLAPSSGLGRIKPRRKFMKPIGSPSP